MRVAVSGFFRIPHVGHVRLFEAAKKLGDELVVIVNNDAQYYQKYGEMPPIPLGQVVELVSAFRVVDQVVVSIDANASVAETIKLVKPDVFANGGDRKPGNLNQDEVRACNELDCRMVWGVGGTDKANSYSALLRRIRQQN